MSYLVTLRIQTLKELATLPEDLEMVHVQPEGAPTGAIPLPGFNAVAAERWNNNTRVRLVMPEIPYNGTYSDIVNKVIAEHSGEGMPYSQVKLLIGEYGGNENNVSQIRAAMKNYGLIVKE